MFSFRSTHVIFTPFSHSFGCKPLEMLVFPEEALIISANPGDQQQKKKIIKSEECA